MSTTNQTKPVILTGLRANNDLHIGNYFGALLPLIDMAKKHSDKYQVNLMMADLHSFSTPIDHSLLNGQIQDNLRTYAAAGLPLDNPDIRVFRESYVSAHAELAHILDAFTGVGEMLRMTQFKDKSAKIGNDRVSMALLNYPPLMAADILLYGAQYIPVGDDQSQHLEYTRDIAQRLNSKFGDLFIIPHEVKKQHEFFGKEQGLRIKDLVDPTKKMSKSDDSGKGIIFLGDDPKAAAKKIMSATTDSDGVVSYDPEKKPGISNLLQILGLLRGGDFVAVREEFVGVTEYGSFKKVVADEVEVFLTNFQKSFNEVDPVALEAKLAESEAKMNEIANQTLLKVQKAVGLR
jgi:tryptophanyl-tRNA synthetase